MHVRHCKHINMAAEVEGSSACRKCEKLRVGLGRDERKKKKCRPGKSRKEETVEKMGQNGGQGSQERGINAKDREII